MTEKKITLRSEVARFAQDMERVLRANDHKGGWQNETTGYLSKRLHQEVHELSRELMRKPRCCYAVRKEAADVANFAMMIADVCESGWCV